MNWLMLIVGLGLAYYTLSYAVHIWKSGKRGASLVVVFLAVMLVVVPFFVR